LISQVARLINGFQSGNFLKSVIISHIRPADKLIIISLERNFENANETTNSNEID